MSESLPYLQWANLQKSLIWAYRGRVGREYSRGRMGAFHITLWHLRKGSVRLTMPCGTTEAAEGQWILVPPADLYQEFSDDAEIWSFRFQLDAPGNQCYFKTRQAALLDVGLTKLPRRACRLILATERLYGSARNHLLGKSAEPSAHLELEAEFLLFLGELLRTTEANRIPTHGPQDIDSRVLACIWHLQSSPRALRTSEVDLARSAGLSVSQLNRLFQRSLGVSSRKWQDDFRLNKAKQLLGSRHAVKETAYALGFSSPQHFSTWFKKRTRQTPSHFRGA